jgi:formiminoglutamase
MRSLEGRHSGNSFSYAIHNGYLKQYHVIGLHQSYNSQYILDELRAKNCIYSFFDEYVQGNSFTEDLEGFFKSVNTDYYGVDLDMDAIEYMPSSAITPTGISIHQARKYVCQMAQSKNVLYLHLPEASPTDKSKYLIGKTLAYLVSDFIKTNQK